jgi:hypothetical protein
MRRIECSLLILATVVATSLPVRAQQDQSNTQINQSYTPSTTDLIGAGVSLINNIFNPPSKSAEIAAQAEIKKAEIAAQAEIAKEKLRLQAAKDNDRVTPILEKWGVKRVNCGANAAFVTGITTDTVCIQPTNAMPAGYYTYNSAKQQLVRTSGNTDGGGVTTRTSVSAESNGNTQTIRNEQSVRVVSPARTRSFTGGF